MQRLIIDTVDIVFTIELPHKSLINFDSPLKVFETYAATLLRRQSMGCCDDVLDL